jgi:hypothetical protein
VRPPNPNEFVFLSKAASKRCQIIECPNHAFGRIPEGLAELRRRAALHPAGWAKFGQLCVSRQKESLTAFRDELDVIGINPFVKISDVSPEPNAAYWPGCDHFLLNRVRELRRCAGRTTLWARIAVGTVESRYITGRAPSYEEIKWLTLAAIGGGFDGVIWVGGFKFDGRLSVLQTAVEQRARELPKARPVRWAHSDASVWISARASRRKLYIVVLNGRYFPRPRRAKVLPFPLNTAAIDAAIELTLPLGLTPTRGVTLDGREVTPEPSGRGQWMVHFEVDGGGTMLILPVSDDGTNTAAKENAS